MNSWTCTVFSKQWSTKIKKKNVVVNNCSLIVRSTYKCMLIHNLKWYFLVICMCKCVYDCANISAHDLLKCEHEHAFTLVQLCKFTVSLLLLVGALNEHFTFSFSFFHPWFSVCVYLCAYSVVLSHQ